MLGATPFKEGAEGRWLCWWWVDVFSVFSHCDIILEKSPEVTGAQLLSSIEIRSLFRLVEAAYGMMAPTVCTFANGHLQNGRGCTQKRPQEWNVHFCDPKLWPTSLNYL
jgi:hypothetical protein